MNATTADELLEYYENTFLPLENELYNALRDYFADKLAEYDSDNPFECDIEIKREFELSYEPTPCIVSAWYDREHKDVYFQEELLGDYPKEASEYPLFELMSIVEGFKEYFGE